MSNHINIHEFKKLCLQDLKEVKHQHQGEEYLNEHLVRLYETFLVCSKLLSASRSRNILSAGAGIAYVEAQLNKMLQAQVSIIDFPESIKLNEKHYSKHRFNCHPADLSRNFKLSIQKEFDLILSCEIIEYLPIAPSNHIASLINYLIPGGYFIITTPNLARLWSIVQLLLGRPLAPEPELTFSPVSFKNEGIHRREYIESEIISAMTKNSLEHTKTYYIWNNKAYSFKRFAFLPFQIIKPSFRPTMLVVGSRPPETKRGYSTHNPPYPFQEQGITEEEAEKISSKSKRKK
ncbi:MAG: class I SAM-dependent methyltransferase [Candidatus Marinimicrobia bacterium]|nr:class I SAM-dependent methyltransferase [Candidatus Neomarinimicrobiota bacterium]